VEPVRLPEEDHGAAFRPARSPPRLQPLGSGGYGAAFSRCWEPRERGPEGLSGLRLPGGFVPAGHVPTGLAQDKPSGLSITPPPRCG